ncbi:MAG: hypothetical protein U0Y96_00270 [Candidatus Kapaibacterium sp.]|nr:hypothetical protein [Bacteroidota bacterium]
MRQNFFNLSIAFVLIFTCFQFYQNVYAQCPPGWNYAVRPLVINGCTYNVSICYTCSPTGANPATVTVLNIDQNGCPPVDLEDVRLALIADYKNLCTVQPCGGDCSLQMSLLIEMPSCWQWYYNMNFINGEWHFYSWRVPCGERFCGTWYKVCYDQATGQVIKCQPWQIIKTARGTACPNTAKIPWPQFFDPATMHYNVNNEPWQDCYQEEECTF